MLILILLIATGIPSLTFLPKSLRIPEWFGKPDPFWYGTLDSLNLFRHTRAWTPYDYKLSNQMQDVLVAFAKTGNPATAEAKIPRYNPKHEQRLIFGDDGISVETLNPKQIDFVEHHPFKFN